MNRRIKTQKKPMTTEQKEIRKKIREAQSAADKARIAKTVKVTETKQLFISYINLLELLLIRFACF